MTTSLMPAPDAAPEPLLLPVALTEADANRISAAISAARTESTRRVYACTWGQWAVGAPPATSVRCPATPPHCAPT